MSQTVQELHLAHYLANARLHGSRYLTPEITAICMDQLFELIHHFGLAEATFQAAMQQAISVIESQKPQKISFSGSTSVEIIAFQKPEE